MSLDHDACYRALSAKDHRFDGVFFVGVETTGIYCRPICPARTPGRTRCQFFVRPIEAEQAGFRACFRCRPELAPGSASVDALSRLTTDAMRRIDAGVLNEQSVDELATALGVTGRHLRRAMQSELGVSPIDLAQARRLALAKQLLHDSALTITEIGLVAGFSSLRRFNAAFREHFGRAPSALKKDRVRSPGAPISVRLDYVPPYDWDGVLAFLRGRAIAGVETVDDGVYRRVVRTKNGVGWLSVRPHAPRSLAVELHVPPTPEIADVIARLRSLFDLDARPHAIAERLREHPTFRPLVDARPGLRVPGAFDGFELAIRAVLGQQISVRAATTLSGRLVAAFGEPSGVDVPGLDRVFPLAATLANVDEPSMIEIGLPTQRARAILAVARAVADGQVTVDPCADPEQAVLSWQEVRGIGPWTAHYIAMRALRWPDAFPSGDLAVMKALGVTTPRQAEAMSVPLKPWRAYAAMHLWSSLSGGG